jgi:F-type H+-transporting ATPase subunit gamma
MENLNEIRARISAIEETRKITNTMNLVSSSRIKKILKSLEYNTIYFERVTSVMRDILTTSGTAALEHPYIAGHKVEIPKKMNIVVAGDRSLAGAYNHNVLTFAHEQLRSQENPSIMTVGNMARDYHRKNAIKTGGYTLRHPADQTLHNARSIVLAIKDLYDHCYIDEIDVIYTAFFGKDKNKPVIRKLLPIQDSNVFKLEDAASQHKENLIEYYPSADATFDLLIPQYLIGMMFDVLVQAYAGEQYARMNAMDSATQNADEILKTLKLSYNLARQATITNEIAEVASASAIVNEDDEDESEEEYL